MTYQRITSDLNELRFAGQQYDAESGLCYNRFRYYHPDSGCYLSPDPLGLMGGLNTHAYVPNPTGWIDPLGLAGCANIKSPAQRLADKAQGLSSAKRPNTVAVIKHADGSMTVGRNQGGIYNSSVQNALENAPHNSFDGQCAEINALSRAMNKGRSLEGATISVSNVRGPTSTTGIHGTPKTPCCTCASVLEQLGVEYIE